MFEEGQAGLRRRLRRAKTKVKMAAHGQSIPDRVVRQQFFELRLRRDGIVWLTRGSEPYASVADLHKAYDGFLAAVDDWLLERRIASGRLGTRERLPTAWLFDLRFVSSSRNDPAFEKAVQRRQADVVKRSPLVAVLVKTAIGRMQMNRLRQAEDQGDPEVFDDPDRAVRWLVGRMEGAAGSGAK